MRVSSNKNRGGFTLVELLVVIAIIGFLVSLLLPAVQMARESSRRSACANNMRQIALAQHNHHDTRRVLPPGCLTGISTTDAHEFFNIPPGVAKYSWVPFLLPYLEQQALADNFKFPLDWRDAQNQLCRETLIPVLVCPSSPQGRQPVTGKFSSVDWKAARTDYAVLNYVAPQLKGAGLIDDASADGWDGMMRTNEVDDFSRCRDGLSNTMWTVEVAGRPTRYLTGAKIATGTNLVGAAWIDPQNQIALNGTAFDGTGTSGPCAVNCSNNNEIYAFHPGGAMGVMGDASVRFLNKNISLRVMAALVTPQVGEIVSVE